MTSRYALPFFFLSLAASPLAFGQLDFDPAVSYTAGQRPDTSAVADLNGDGILDVATTADDNANDDIVAIRFGSGDGTFGARFDFFLGNNRSVSAIVATNLDGDADMDLVVTFKEQQVVQTLINDGSGNFAFGTQAPVGDRPIAMVAADFDGDGDPDLAVSNRDGNSVTVLTNNGASFSTQTLAVGNEPRGIDAGDLDGDGDPDLAVGVHDDRTVQLLTNNGGSFSLGATLSTGAQRRPEGVAIGDLDADGDMDLAAATSGNGFNSVSVWLNNGAFAGPTHWPTAGMDPGAVAIADYDLDGTADLSVAESDSGTLSALRGLGGGTFAAAVSFSAGTSPEHIAQGDLDGNGSMDLVITNRDSSDISVLTNRAAGGGNSWEDLGFGLAGSLGVPTMTGTGTLAAGSTVTIRVEQGLPNGTGVLFLGDTTLFAPFKGGTLVPDPDFFFFGQSLDATGARTYQTVWPSNIPADTQVVLQMWIFDGNAVQGLSATNGLRGTAE